LGIHVCINDAIDVTWNTQIYISRLHSFSGTCVEAMHTNAEEDVLQHKADEPFIDKRHHTGKCN